MSKLARILTVGAMLAAMNLAGLTAVAHATDHPAATQDGQRPPTERQVGEAWHHQVPAIQPTAANPRPPLERQVGEAWRHHTSAGRPAAPRGRPGRLVTSLGILGAAVVGSAGVAVLVAKRTRRRVRVGQTA